MGCLEAISQIWKVCSKIWEVCSQIWGPISQHVGYIRDLNDNVTNLKKETGRVKNKRVEVEDEVNAAELVGKKRRCDVGDWLQDVNDIVAEADSIQSEVDRGETNLLSRHSLGKRVVEKIEAVKTLQNKGAFDKVATSPRRPLMPELQVPSQVEQQSTSQKMLREIEEALSDEKIGIVSVCGMGGIGKTTLMKEIYNKLRETQNFNPVLWVTVSKDLNLNVIQQKIGNKLGVQFHKKDSIEDKRDKLYACLKKVSYMLILDDLWQRFSLDHIGIPQPNKENRCKIVITTRSVEVGNGMEADSIIRVKILSSVEAWELFRSKTGDVVLQPEIQTLAEEVVRECAGLPLAINTVGGAMRRKGQMELWQNALRALKAPAAPEVPGMKREVFLPLKLSYESLGDPKIKSCFLYCSLYPEDYEIDTEELVRYWAFEEGLINNVSSLDDALNKGHGIIDRLKDACLLEDGHHGDRYVRMHDLLRDLAIWITSPSSPSSSSSSSFFLVKAGEELEQPPEEKTWEGMERISLMRNQITELQMTPNCPDLVSLSLSDNRRLDIVHNNFFQLMPKLQILDLSGTYIKSLPPSLSQLVKLRVLDASQCRYLHDVPPLGHLEELQFLDLGDTGIESLPQGIASLSKLRSLELSETKAPAAIPRGFISGLTSLEDLGLYSCGRMMSMEIWRDVAALPRLTNLRIILPSLDLFSPNDMNHPMWSRLSRFMVQFGRTGAPLSSPDYRNRTLLIYDCKELPSLQKAFGGESPTGFQQLKSISISGCHKLRCIFSAGMLQHLQSLKSLIVHNCKGIVEMVEGGPLPDMAMFPKLKSIRISDCRKLRCVFSSSMLQHLHLLERLEVYNCEEIVDIVEGGPLPDTLLQRFKDLRLDGLPKLERISIFACKIFISGCDKLRCIFSSSMLQHLQLLESLTVKDCEEIVEIVEGGPLPDTALQRFKDLHLDGLPKLERISIFACKVFISGCDKLRCIFSSSMLQHLQLLEILTVEDCEEIVEIVEGGPLPDTALQRLRHLRLEKLPKLKSISISARDIDISGCHKLRCIFSSSMLQHLHPLESLTVEDCEEMVEIVEGGPLPDTALQRFKDLHLDGLPKLERISIVACKIFISGCDKLRSIFSSSVLQHLQLLESLTVENCEEIVETVEGGPLPDTALQRFKDLHLDGLPKLERISIFACKVFISGCDKLRCIFSSSMLQHLQLLESLTVENCEEIVEIVEGGPLPDTALQRLRDLSLKKLPKLERISVSVCDINISGCDKLRCIFSSSMLQHLQLLESLTVKDCEEIVEIMEGGPLPGTAILPKLDSISISGCHKLRCIFSSSMLQHLHQLESLEVRDCEEIVEIVGGGPLPDTVILPKLDSFSISGCHKLSCIFSSSMLQHMQSLESLSVSNCEEIVEIVEGGPLPDTVLQRLRRLSLNKLPQLTAICSQQLVLTSMEWFRMEDCPELKKLPVLCSSAIQEISGWIGASREWWEGIEWEEEHSKSLYSTIYRERQGDDFEEASEAEDDEEASETEDEEEASEMEDDEEASEMEDEEETSEPEPAEEAEAASER